MQIKYELLRFANAVYRCWQCKFLPVISVTQRSYSVREKCATGEDCFLSELLPYGGRTATILLWKSAVARV